MRHFLRSTSPVAALTVGVTQTSFPALLVLPSGSHTRLPASELPGTALAIDLAVTPLELVRKLQPHRQEDDC
jgi:hypothetical protein